MSLTLYFHPFSSFCQKVLIALYENGTPFEGRIVDLGDESSSAELKRLWPMGKFPVLRDEAAGRTIPEATIIVEHLAERHPGPTRLIPADPDLAWETRRLDRFHDLYVNVPMQKIVTDRIRPAGKGDPHGVADARRLLGIALDLVEAGMGARTWAVGDAFTMADCSAAPALFYANEVIPFEGTHPNVWRYLRRLKERPSFARVLEEARPYFKLFPR